MKKVTKILLSTAIVYIIMSVSLICIGRDNGRFTDKIKNENVISVPTKSFKEIDVSVTLGSVCMKTGNYAIKIEYSKEIDEVDWQIIDGKLKIDIEEKASQKGKEHYRDCPKITIFIPKDKQLGEISIYTRFGDIDIEKLNAKKVEVDTSQGSINLNEINIGNLTVDNSMGKVGVTGDVTESIDIKNSMGKAELNLKRPENYYDYDLDCSMGKVKINGHKINGQSCRVFGSGQIKSNNKAGKPLKIYNSMGDIDVNFKN